MDALTDRERLDWLQARPERLREVYWRIENEGGTVRDAIDWLAHAQRREDGEAGDGVSVTVCVT